MPPGMPGNNSAGTMGNSSGDPNQPEQKGATTLEIAEAKALKAINKYSVIKHGEEQNKQIFDAYMILAQARIYRGKSLDALDALNYVFTHMKDDKRIPLARIYQGLAYDQIKNYHKAHETFAKLKSEKISREYEKLLSIYYSESLLDAGKKQEAVKELDDAFELNSNRKLKSRIAYLRGQVLESRNQNDKARESFMTASLSQRCRI